MNSKNPFYLNTKLEGSILQIDIGGYLNVDCGEAILHSFNELVDKGVIYCYLNVENVTDINSSGLSILIEIIDILHKIGGHLCLINIPPKIEKVLDLMGLFDYAKKGITLSNHNNQQENKFS